MKVLITGIAGFLGSNLQNYLINSGHSVVGIDNLSGGYLSNINKETVFYESDCRDKDIIDFVFQAEKPDVLFHFSADAAENRAQFTPVSSMENNFQSSINVFTSAIRYGVKRIIFSSSIAVYGNQKPPFVEDQQLKPIDLYAVNKRATEEALKILCDVHGVEHVIFRPYNIVGRFQNLADPYRNVAAIFINRLMNNQPPLIYGDGKQKRAFSPVENLMPVFERSMTADVSGQTYNIGPEKALTVNSLANKILNLMESDLKPQHVDERPHEVKLAWCDNSKVIKDLEYEELVSLDECLSNMILWAKEIGYQKPKYLENLELVNKNTPEVWIKKQI